MCKDRSLLKVHNKNTHLEMLRSHAIGEQEEKLPLEFFELLLSQKLQNLLELIHEQHLRGVTKEKEKEKQQ